MKKENIVLEAEKVGKDWLRKSKVDIPWRLRTLSKMEYWWLKNVGGLDPSCERVVRVYTYNTSNFYDYELKCPNYTFDLFSCLYDDFVEVAHEIGQELQTTYEEVTGDYFYDVKISLNWFRVADPEYGYEWDMDYDWVILDTDNPRCLSKKYKCRKNCDELINKNSLLQISGYSLNGNYCKFVDVLSDLANKTIVIHSKSDARALLKVFKFLGVRRVSINNKLLYNTPSQNNFFSKNAFGYRVLMSDNQMVAQVINRTNMPTQPWELMDIDEFIIKRTLKVRLRDFLQR